MKRIVITLTLLSCLVVARAQWVSTVAGVVETPGSTDGAALSARFFIPHGIAVDTMGHIFIADRDNHTIRMFDTNTGMVSTIAGMAGEPGSADGLGSAARFNEPWGICATPDGVLYVADTKNNKVRKIALDGTVTTIAGTGNFGTSNGAGLSSTFGDPTGIEVDSEGNIYVADHLTHIIRKINKLGLVTTLAGTPYVPGDADGTGPSAEFWRPYGLTLDPDGNILVADEWNHKIRKVTPLGEVTTLAGSGLEGLQNGPATDAAFSYPWDLTVDDNGNVYVADGYNYVIRKIKANGEVETLAGSPQQSGSQDGNINVASFKGATGIAWSLKTRDLFVCDAFNHLIRNVTVDGAPPASIALVNVNGGTTICEGEEITLSASPAAFANYRFFLDGNLVQDDEKSEFTTSTLAPGTHQFWVETDHEGEVLTAAQITLTVLPAPVTSISAVGALSFYEGDSVILIASGLGDFLWSNAETTQTITVTESGTYFVELTAGSCTGISAPVLVEVTPLPDGLSVLVQGNGQLCPDGSVLLTSSAASGNQWLHNGWPLSGQTGQTLEATEAGLYSVQHTDPATGITALSAEVEIKAAEARAFDFEALPKSGVPGQPISFVSSGADQPVGYEWQFGDPASGLQNSSQQPNATHVFANEGLYDIQLVATDASGCKHTLLKPDFVQIRLSTDVFLPNAFTPNGDGENDLFRARGLVDGSFYMAVYNQWGELLFQTENPATGWDGTKDGLPVAPGTYAYFVQTAPKGKVQEVSGMVTLLR
ncbi:MAG: gliding motility-associated C-terminal domain-containing protein [Saprospiraceae bacterium]|nr:gliding motility-associated C-terminal domain-containing protein [Saprospiraceae bacterium]